MKKKIATPSKTKQILRQNEIRLKKSLGQNFLVDYNIIDKIAAGADLNKGDYVIEIGPGIGSLTQKLAEEAEEVWAIELDERLISILKDNLNAYDNINYIHADALEYDFQGLLNNLDGSSVKVVANLPYYITTPIIMRLLEERLDLDRVVVMVQKEVAERMVATPEDGKDYGSLSLAVQYYSEPIIYAHVPKNVFIPQPKVDSAVVSMQIREEPPVEVKDKELLFSIIKAAFQQRRKTIRNSLSKAANIDLERDLVDAALAKVEIDSRRRGEKLTLERFADLSNTIFNLLN
ncbi:MULTISPECIES: 16S rRNA (adenine(1518)-N(6)/adenine(1519)-N(6))-dimethyltransferase RsmA [unclassified Candidatus Frackibacter]|uniref:16S rRNA (adenine(1518)-N(6)/adenine(1519)-N(6))- dimethyltransferase RsmA n=1 Tax=unclassified Candidatus Frackibacter TaxID=2648818 RepID=UPI00088C61AC|nr:MULTISPECIES: 16S rRNA (adenine(1518)-N(6)/adenine(1519)-N(6))-dimethyltransferase RsmA [unclassified Candidatus Frackibacter]SDC54916.1 dimethyladenosine transferase [Candidatus Frackibacter sp. WG11]SEM67025.1 dimethyladenosine transferase [Candidatus Frackibacter sp. WG12]SFL78314.1 dimethyladenosine transferase [Candidatus Frackibacter sp. WG13]